MVLGSLLRNCFQQNWAPPHFIRPVGKSIDQPLPERWIDPRGQVEWPSRPPDLMSFNFFFLWVTWSLWCMITGRKHCCVRNHDPSDVATCELLLLFRIRTIWTAERAPGWTLTAVNTQTYVVLHMHSVFVDLATYVRNWPHWKFGFCTSILNTVPLTWSIFLSFHTYYTIRKPTPLSA